MGMDEYKVYTYVYGELDCDDNIVYVGKSNNPRFRNMTKGGVKRYKILDKFIDIEQRWIHQLSSSGVKLRNKEVIKTCVDHEVGDIIDIVLKKPRPQVKHIPTQMVFESRYAASRYFGMNPSWLNTKIREGNSSEWEII